jgi:PleD family two-component response regulator
MVKNIIVSTGLFDVIENDFKSMLISADKNLYMAKETGRNKLGF